MDLHSGEQSINQLEKRKGGYYYLFIDAQIVNAFERKKATRIICKLDDTVSFRCGFNHLGDGNFYIIIAKRYIDKLKKGLGDRVKFQIEEDPDQLGVEMPEVLEVLLEQDSDAKEIFSQLTDGKKRSLIYSIAKSRNIDKQVQNILDFLQREKVKNK